MAGRESDDEAFLIKGMDVEAFRQRAGLGENRYVDLALLLITLAGFGAAIILALTGAFA